MSPRAVRLSLANPHPEVEKLVDRLPEVVAKRRVKLGERDVEQPTGCFVQSHACSSWETRWGETSSTTAMSAPDRPDPARSFAAARHPRESAIDYRQRHPRSEEAVCRLRRRPRLALFASGITASPLVAPNAQHQII